MHSCVRTGLPLAVALGLFSFPRTADAQAQVGYGPMQTYNFFGGVGPYGWGPYAYGIGPYGAPPGMPSVAVYDQQQSMLAAQMEQSARYQLESAQAAYASAAANALRRQALGTARNTRRRTLGPATARFDVRDHRPAAANPEPAEPDRAFTERLGSLIDPTGQVLWPVPIDDLTTPTTMENRRTAEDTVSDVYQSFIIDGQAPLAQVIEARQALRLFGQPILDELRVSGDGVRLDRLRSHLNTLDAALVDMANPPQP